MHFLAKSKQTSVLWLFVSTKMLVFLVMLLAAQSAASNNSNELYYDTVKVSIVDYPHFSGTFEVVVTSKSTDFKFRFFRRDTISGEPYCVERDIKDVDGKTKRYLRKLIIHFFIKNDKKKYRFYEKNEYKVFSEPEPGWIAVEYTKDKEEKYDIMYLTNNIKSKRWSCNNVANIIYAPGYRDFLQKMLKLTHKYSDVYMRRYEPEPGVWYWDE